MPKHKPSYFTVRPISAPHWHQRLIENGSRLAQQFSADRYVKAYQQLYQEVLNQNEGRK